MAGQGKQPKYGSTSDGFNPFVPRSRKPVPDDWDDMNLSDAEIEGATNNSNIGGQSGSSFDQPATSNWPNFEEYSDDESDDSSGYHDRQSLAHSTSPPQLVWPSRLLHVKTMVSYEAKKIGDDFYYNNIPNPKYNTISYVWGRYQVKHSEKKGGSVAVSGITWDVPSILMDHFTPDQLQHALKIATENTEWVWLDIACIDQDKSSHRLSEELGKQSAIFTKAAQPYIWLSDVPLADMKAAVNGMENIAIESRTKNLPYNAAEQGCIIRLFESSWFSSLWTLQEAYFCKRAIILSREGEAIQVSNIDDGSAEKLTLNWLIAVSNELEPWNKHDHSTGVKRPLTQALDKSGISLLKANNPMVALSSSTKRSVTVFEDRIYGIMQIFELQLVNRTNSSPDLEVEELETKLAQGINMHSLAIGQGFVHLVADRAERAATVGLRPRRRDARSTNKQVGGVVPGFDFTFRVPPTLYDIKEVEYDKKAQIFFDTSKPRFEGYQWDLEDVEEQWNTHYPDAKKNSLYMSIYMDEGSFITRSQIPVPSLVTGDTSTWPEVSPVPVLRGLLAVFPEALKVLVLGQLESPSENGYIGLIVVKSKRPGVWDRVGICSWPQEPDQLQKTSCYLGSRIFYDRTEGRLYGNYE